MSEKDDAAPEHSGSDATSTQEAEQGDGALRVDEPSMGSTSKTDAPSRWRRLHTISGAVVLGAFLVEHLFTNASALGGFARYDAVVGAIERFPLLPLFEVVFIVVPLAFHAGYGLHLLRGAQASERDADIARFGDRRAWMLQRTSAVVLFLFILFHVWELRLQGLPADALYTTLTAHLSWTWVGVPWIALFYLLGVLAAAAHLSNGLFAAAVSFQLAADRIGRRRVRTATTALGLILFLVGGTTVIGLATGTRLLPGADDDSAAPSAPCGSAVPVPSPPFTLPTPSR